MLLGQVACRMVICPMSGSATDLASLILGCVARAVQRTIFSSLPSIWLLMSDISSLYSFGCAKGIWENNCKSTIMLSRRSN